MGISIYQINKKLKQYKRARTLYQQGLTTRDIGKIFKPKKSRQWVWFCVKGKGIKLLEKLNLPDLTLKPKV